MESLRHTLFVYGTLMRGECNHALLRRARYLGAARTAAGYALLNLGAYPALVPGDGHVSGELFRVDAATLRAVDRLEEHPRYYRRIGITLADGRHAAAYLLPRRHALGRARIASGDWRTR